MGYDISSDEGGHYLRRGAGYMGPTAQDMVNCGLAYPSPIPKYRDHVRSEDSSERDRQREFWLTWAGCEERPGIPTHKFSTNDGWHIRADEIVTALEHGDTRAFGRLHPDALEFFRQCAKTGTGAQVW